MTDIYMSKICVTNFIFRSSFCIVFLAKTLSGQITFEGNYGIAADRKSAKDQVCKYIDL